MTTSDTVSRQGFWERLNISDRNALDAAGFRQTFAPNGTLLAQHDTSRDVMIVRSGFTRIVAPAAGERYVVLALRGPGDIIGELALASDGRRSATVAAINDVEVLRIDASVFIAFLHRSPHAMHLLQRTIVDRLREADRDRVATASMNVGQRLARLLCKLIQRYGVPDDDGGATVDYFSQEELAGCIGGARRSVVREMRQWRERRIISTSRRSITVHRPDELIRIAGRAAPPV